MRINELFNMLPDNQLLLIVSKGNILFEGILKKCINNNLIKGIEIIFISAKNDKLIIVV